ncbi:MAG TPA: DUF937 domain-containing protein [Candidatus Limnocylindrales bacterium]|nr:DUF937 domain-containing protein [Candidatus Limnocylindrales bacterium]
MTANTDMLQELLSSQADQIGARIGADPAQTQQAISAALPALLAGLQQQATPGSGLQQAIEQDHDGSILDNLSGYLNGTANLDSRTTDGQGILEHVLGDRQQPVAQALSSQTGLSSSTIMQLLPLLAPIVMGMLGRQARSESPSSGSGGFGDLGSILGGLLGGGATGAGTNTSGGGLDDLLGGILGGGNRNR